MDRIRKYFDLIKDEDGQRLNDAFCNDLHVNELYTFINHTKSAIGAQYLYALLRDIRKKSQVAEFEHWIDALKQEPESREKILSLLGKLNQPDAYDIIAVLTQKLIPYDKKKVMLFRGLQLIPSLLLGLFLITQYSFLIIALLLAFFVNLAIHYRTKNIAFVYSGSMPQLHSLLTVAEKLSAIPLNQTINPTITGQFPQLKGLRRKLSIFRIGVKLESDMAMLAYGIQELIKIFLLTDPLNLNSAFLLIRKHQTVLKEIFDYTGLIDSLQSVATVRELNPASCQPRFEEKPMIDAVDIYHPLITDCIPNNFRIEHQFFLVLGSNMSGKTSFIRTVGVNVLLAQTLNFCFAREMTLSRQRIFSSISMEDSLMEGQSYYLREVLQMKSILNQTTEGYNLILLDELFRGTNTVERIAGAKAVLSYLTQNKKNLIIVATHDIELIELLKDQYRPIYFTEDITGQELSFSYKIHYEKNPQRNAIRILDLYGYPKELIDDAMRTARG